MRAYFRYHQVDWAVVGLCFARFPHSLIHILILILPQNITTNKAMTEAEINVGMGDGMADVEMEAIAIGMDEEGTPTGGTEDKEEKEKDLL